MLALKCIARSGLAVAILAVANASGVSIAQAQAPAPSVCRFQTVAELPLRFERNRPLMEAKVDGKKVWFLADTGAVVSVIFTDGAKYLNLPTSHADGVFVGGVGGAADARRTVVPELQMGGYARKDTPFIVAGGGELSSPPTPGEKEPVVGVFGRDLFGQVDFEFDLAASKLRLFKPIDCEKTWLGYWSNAVNVAPIERSGVATDVFRIPVKLNGRTVDAILDSGAQISVVTPSAAQRAGAELTAASGGESARSRGLGPRAVDTQIGKFDSVSVGDEQVKNTHLRVARLFEDFEDDIHAGSHVLSSSLDPDMLLGADFLRSHRVLVSTSQGKIYFTYSGGPVFQVVGKAVDPSKAQPLDGPPPPGQGASQTAPK